MDSNQFGITDGDWFKHTCVYIYHSSRLDLFLPNNDAWFQWNFSIVPEWKINLNSLFDVIFYQFAAA